MLARAVVRLPNWIVAAIVGCVCAVAVAPSAVIGERSLLPWGAMVYDPVFAPSGRDGPAVSTVWDASGITIHYPAQLLAAAELRAGRAPLWNHLAGTGAPLLAEAHSAPLSPLLLPFWLSPSEITYSWFLLLRLALAGFAMFLLARRLALSHPAAVLAAVTYAVGGCAAARFHLPTEGTAYAMLPLVVLAAQAAAAGKTGAIAILALVVGATIGVAHPELAALAGAGGCAIALSERYRDRGAWLRVGAGLGGGVLVAAVIVVPFVVYVLSAASYKKEPGFARHFVSDLQYFRLAPDVLRFGAAPLLLAGIAALRWRDDAALAAMVRVTAAAIALFATLLVLQAGLGPPVGSAIPPRYALFLIVFAVAVLAGYGLDQLRTRGIDDKQLALGLGAGAAAWLGSDLLAGGLLHELADIWSGDLIAALLVPLAVVVLRNRERLTGPLTWTIVAVTGLTLVLSFQRVLHAATAGAPTPAVKRAVRELPAPPARVAGVGSGRALSLTPNMAGHYGKADARAAAALYPPRYRKYWSLIEGAELGPTSVALDHARSPLVRLLGVRRLIAAGSDGVISITPIERPMPRAFIPPTLIAASDVEAAAARLSEIARRDAIDREVVIEADTEVVTPLQNGTGTVRIVKYTATRVVLEVRADKPALVVLTDTYDPGWHVTVDGKRRKSYAVDVLFRGVAVPAGNHRIVMSYRPPSFTLGLWISLLATLACLGWLIWVGPIRWTKETIREA